MKLSELEAFMGMVLFLEVYYIRTNIMM